MKRLLAILLAFLMLTACGAKPAPEDSAEPPETQEETETTSEPAETVPEASNPPGTRKDRTGFRGGHCHRRRDAY